MNVRHKFSVLVFHIRLSLYSDVARYCGQRGSICRMPKLGVDGYHQTVYCKALGNMLILCTYTSTLSDFETTYL
jgi:hypothetical protein